MIGQQISNFQINSQLGSGGMGTVYKAKDLRLNRNVAIKMLHPYITNKSNAYKRFQNEAQISAQINHPNVATLYDFISHNGRSYLIMEFVNGETIESLLSYKSKFSQQECIDIAVQMLKGLGEAHKLNILHRDLKPGNIMVNKNGFTKLMDFGIARFNNSTRLTAQNKVIGTAEYIAPEIYQNKQPSKVSDLYAIGVILYEMLSGKPLFKAESEATLIYKVVNGKTDFDLKDTHPQFSTIIKNLTHKNPKKRYRTAEEVVQALLAINLKRESNGLPFKNLLQPLKTLQLPNLQWNNLLAFPLLKNVAVKFLLASVIASIIIIGLGSLVFDSEKDNGQADVSNLEIPVTVEDTPSGQDQSSFVNAPIETTVPENIEVKETTLPQIDKAEFIPVEEPKAKENKENDQPKSIEKEQSVKKKTSTSSNSSKKAESQNVSQPTSIEKSSASKTIQEKANEELQTETIKEEVQEKVIEEPTIEKPEPLKSKRIYIDQQYLQVRFGSAISSQQNKLGEVVYLEAAAAIYKDGVKVVAKGAPVKARITQLKRKNNGKVLFALQIFAVQTNFKAWLDLDYPEYSKIEKGTVVFPSNTQLSKVKIKSQETQIKY
jgi:serine/threonine-protein kinase